MKLFKYVTTGLSIGFVVTTFSLLIFNSVNETNLELLGWCIASAIYGGSSILFEIESIKQIYINILHYLICLGTTFTMIGLFYTTALPQLLGILAYFTIIYVIIYIIMALIQKKQVKEINAQLSKR